MGFFDGIKNALDSVKGDAEKRKALKAVEQQAYARQKEIQEELKWQEEIQKAEARGVLKAKTTPAERIKADIQERREKVKERKDKLAATRAAKVESGGSRMSQSMKGVVSTTAAKKTTAVAIVGAKKTNSAVTSNKKPLSLKK